MSEYDNSEAKFKLMREFGDWDDGFDDAQPSVKEIMKGRINSPSAVEGEYATFGVYQLVGHGKQTNDRCGTFRKVVGCSRAELHNKMIFDKKGRLVDCRGKGYFRPVFHSCDRPSCPTCYERGWAIREASNMDFRLGEIAKRLDHVAYGDVEHCIVNLPPKYWGLDYAGLRDLCDHVLLSRGVVGGAKIFHGARFNHDTRRWYFSPHFHCLCWIRDGFRRCRGCAGHCKKGCGGFVDRNYRLNEVDGCYVMVKGKRKTIFGTCWYQLHHSTIRTDVKRFHAVTWFGIASYRKMKISKELRKAYDEKHRKKCPICGSDLVRHEYYGRNLSIIAWFRKRRSARESVEGVFDKASDWCEVVERGSGSYGKQR
jgi:hypothetical protein